MPILYIYSHNMLCIFKDIVKYIFYFIKSTKLYFKLSSA